MGIIEALFCLDVHELRYPPDVYKLTWLGSVPSEVAQVIRKGGPLMIGGTFLLGSLSSLIGDRVSRGFSNMELVYLQELRNMGKIEDISPEGK